MPPVVGRFRVLEFTQITDHNWRWLKEGRNVEHDEYGYYIRDHEGPYFWHVLGYTIKFDKDSIILKRDGHINIFKCTYEMKTNMLDNDDIDFIIKYEKQWTRNSAVSRYLIPQRDDLNRYMPIWLRQAKGAQVLATPLPSDLQRHVFGFLWMPTKPGAHGGGLF